MLKIRIIPPESCGTLLPSDTLRVVFVLMRSLSDLVTVTE